MIERPTREDGLLELLLTSAQELIGGSRLVVA